MKMFDIVEGETDRRLMASLIIVMFHARGFATNGIADLQERERGKKVIGK